MVNTFRMRQSIDWLISNPIYRFHLNSTSETGPRHLAIQELLYNSDLRRRREFDCNQQALLDRATRPLIDFNAFANYTQITVMN